MARYSNRPAGDIALPSSAPVDTPDVHRDRTSVARTPNHAHRAIVRTTTLAFHASEGIARCATAARGR